MKSVGIVGTGWIAEVHAKILKDLGIPVGVVIGHNREKTKKFADRWGIPVSGTEPELLYAPEVFAVHLCTPPGMHYEQIKDLLAHKKHIFCEKPLCLSPEEAQELASLAEKAEVCCQIGFNVRFYAACQKAREVVSDSDFGRVLLIHGSYLQEFGAEPAQWSWRYEDRLQAVTEIGSHWLDLSQYISGKKVLAVSAQFDNFHPNRYKKDGCLYNREVPGGEAVSVPSEDVALINLRYEGGAIGAVVLSELSHGRGNRLSLEITGEKQSLWWNSEEHQRLFVASKGEGIKEYRFDDEFEDTFAEIMRGFYCAVEGNDLKNLPDFVTGRDNVLLCHAIWRSAKENSNWVEM